MFSQFLNRSNSARFRRCLTGLTLAALSGLLIETTMAADKPAAEKPVEKPKDELGRTTWGGFGWGIGIATNFDIGGKRVGSVDLVGPTNIVRVKDATSNVNVSFVLEAHYFLRDYLIPLGNEASCKQAAKDARDFFGYLNCTELAHGPFVAIEVGGGATPAKQDGLITAFAMGWMVGMRHPGASLENKNSSWNFGVGLRVTPSSQILGDGIIANQPLPVGETAIRWKNEPRYGVTLLSSFSF